MRSFQSFIAEARKTTRFTRSGDHQGLEDYKMSRKTDTPLEVGRLGADRRKSDVEKRRVKAIGGGKTAPAKSYKARKDIGTNKPRSKVEQQPTRERGSAALSPKEAQKKAYLERKARQAGAKTPTRTQLLTKKTTKTDPKYKPQKASGYTAAERKAITRKGERKLRDLTLAATGKTKESELKHPITSKEITRRNKKQ
tara:strand:+ start:276 stop:866 length:591 start_codon:yes stop_codon:yes gene_type:complete